METGIIKSYNATAGYGYIQPNDGTVDVYFHITATENEIRVLLQNYKYKNEPVVYTKIPSVRKEGEFQAKSLNLDLNKRKVGNIEIGEGKYSTIYFIVDFFSKEKYFLHHSNIRREMNNDRFIGFDEGEPVVFSPSSNEKGLTAEDVVFIDKKQFIESFAEFTDYNLDLLDLADNICEKEDWDFIEKKLNGIPILRSYMNQTCKQLVKQGRIIEAKSSYGEVFSYYNTGLVDAYQNEIYAFFQKNTKFSDNQPWGINTPKWFFKEFNTDQSVYFKYFSIPAPMATYFEETEVEKLVFNTTLSIIPSWEHLLKRKHRIDSIEVQKMTEQEFRDTIEDSITMAKKRIKRNYKTAIPHYYDGDIQFLVPLCQRQNRGKAIAAMVIEKEEQIYTVSTILTLDQAYNNARLLAKPDREWLNP
ncbi:MAG: DUF3825 domain-containing protein [Flavobacteriales bacterium]|nr:DUF3825 domain-containing protein [Flavobacteriales bacterium]